MRDLTKAFYTVKEFAEEMDLHPATIRNAIRKGRIYAFKIGVGKNASYRVPQSEFYRIAELDWTEIEKTLEK